MRAKACIVSFKVGPPLTIKQMIKMRLKVNKAVKYAEKLGVSGFDVEIRY